MLRIDNLSFSYDRRSLPVLDGIALELRDGETGILLGRNGSGKTTLFNVILGVSKPLSGSVTLGGKDILTLSRKERAALIAYVPQDIRFGVLSVFDSVLMGRVSRFGSAAGKKDIEVTEKVLADTGLERYAARSIATLSGGERQKVAIARALAQEPKLLVFDEPTGNLDIANERLMIDEAKRLAGEKDISILSSLHDLNQALAFGDRFYFLKDGRIKYSGAGDVFTQETINDVFDSNVRIIEYENKKIIIGG